jgi:hypothetical protein
MLNKGFLMILAILAASAFSLPLGAQQEGSVAIAGVIVPASESIVDDFAGCVERLIAVKTSNKDARRDCLKATGKKVKAVSDVSDDASGATNASRPLVITNGYGSSYGYGRSYSYSRPIRRTVVVTPQRRSSVRATPQTTKPAVASRPPARSSVQPVRRASTPVRNVSRSR